MKDYSFFDIDQAVNEIKRWEDRLNGIYGCTSMTFFWYRLTGNPDALRAT